MGEDGIFTYLQILHHCNEATVNDYLSLHPITLPLHPLLYATITLSSHVDTNMSAPGTLDTIKSMGDPTPMEVETVVNTAVSSPLNTLTLHPMDRRVTPTDGDAVTGLTPSLQDGLSIN